MCKGKKECTELGTNPDLWSKKCPLTPPSWFENEIELFSKAIKLASLGNIQGSIKILREIKSDELRNWFCEHGQVSGRFRNKFLKIYKIKPVDITCDTLKSPDKYRNEVFKRDNFTCQYCGIKVVPKEVFEIYSKVIGRENFCTHGTNIERHGVILAFRANADHVIPWNRGGKTELENLVTCCWSCNYGKAGYTLEEIMLDNPKINYFCNQNWIGLTEYLDDLKRISRKK
jgi:hypothetical protein